MNPRTKRQREVLDYIGSFISERGYKPSYQQIARHFHIRSKSAVAKHIAALEEQGLLSRYRENGSFGLEVTPPEAIAESVREIEWLKLPFQDVLSEDFEEKPIYVPKFLISDNSGEKFSAFRVRSDAMIEEFIREDDIVLIENRQYARDGDIVVALIEKQRVILRKFFRRGPNYELRAANPNYDLILLSSEKIEIKGVFRSLLRPLV